MLLLLVCYNIAWNIIITITMHPTATCTLTISFLIIILKTLTIPLVIIIILCLNRRRGKAVLPSVNYWVISKIHHKPSLGDRKNTPQAQFVLSKNICSFTIISNICKVLRQYSTGNLIQQTHY